MSIDKTQETFKIWSTTKKLLKIAATLNGEAMTEMAHRLIEIEYKKVVENFASQEGVQVQTETE